MNKKEDEHEKEFLAACKISLAHDPYLRGGETPPFWEYVFEVKVGQFLYRFPVAVFETQEATDVRLEIAKQNFKRLSAVLSKKITEWCDS